MVVLAVLLVMHVVWVAPTELCWWRRRFHHTRCTKHTPGAALARWAVAVMRAAVLRSSWGLLV